MCDVEYETVVMGAPTAVLRGHPSTDPPVGDLLRGRAIQVQSTDMAFMLITVHLVWGSDPALRAAEANRLTQGIAEWATQPHVWDPDIFALGDFNADGVTNLDGTVNPIYAPFAELLTIPATGRFDWSWRPPSRNQRASDLTIGIRELSRITKIGRARVQNCQHSSAVGVSASVEPALHLV